MGLCITISVLEPHYVKYLSYSVFYYHYNILLTKYYFKKIIYQMLILIYFVSIVFIGNKNKQIYK